MVLIRHYKYTYLTNLISVILSLVTCMHPSTMSVRFYLTTGKCNSLTHQYTTRHRKRAVKSRRRYDVPCRGMAFTHLCHWNNWSCNRVNYLSIIHQLSCLQAK